MTDTITFCEERAASYGAMRKSALTAIALDHAIDRMKSDATIITDLQAQLAARDAEIGRLREALGAKPWPPSDAELREMLAVVVGAWWSQSTANAIRTRRLTVEDVKGTYAIRDVLAPYVARAALGQGEG